MSRLVDLRSLQRTSAAAAEPVVEDDDSGVFPLDRRLLLRPMLYPAAPRRPWAARVAGAVHSGKPGLVAPSVDLAVLAAVSLVVLPTPDRAVLVGLSGVALLCSGRVYRDRDRVVARGTGWWPRLLVGPLAVAGLLGALLTGSGLTAPAGRDAALSGTRAAALMAVTSLLALLAVRVLAWLLVVRRRRAGKDLARALVVGQDEPAATLTRTLAGHPEFGLKVVLTVSERAVREPEALAALVRERGCRHVFLLPSDATPGRGLRRSFGVPAHVSVVPFGSDAFLDGQTGRRVGGMAVLPLGRPLRGPAAMPAKRALDVLFAGFLLLVTAPLLLLGLVAVRQGDGSPALDRQRRTGRGGLPFDILKLRTMRLGAEHEQPLLTAYNTSDGLLFKMTDDPRVTRVGRVLRRTGIDELPQLLNVLRGEMSLVGPRPLPVEAEAFGLREGERHLVRPGMTGLWQVSGGSTLRYREMVDLDLAYVHGWTPGLDLHILGATISVLLRSTFGAAGRAR